MKKEKVVFGIDRKVKVSARAYATVMLAQSTEETRYYLNGVLVEPNPAGGVNLVATDGHVLIAVHDKTGETNGSWICPVPSQMRQFLLANLDPRPEPEDHDGFYMDEPEVGGEPEIRQLDQITFSGDMASITSPEHAWQEKAPIEMVMAAQIGAIDGKFPPWAKVVPRPKEDAPNISCFTAAARYGSLLGRAARIMTNNLGAGVRWRGVEQNGPVLAGAWERDDLLMVLMPMRDQDAPFDVPAWVPPIPEPVAA